MLPLVGVLLHRKKEQKLKSTPRGTVVRYSIDSNRKGSLVPLWAKRLPPPPPGTKINQNAFFIRATVCPTLSPRSRAAPPYTTTQETTPAACRGYRNNNAAPHIFFAFTDLSHRSHPGILRFSAERTPRTRTRKLSLFSHSRRGRNKEPEVAGNQRGGEQTQHNATPSRDTSTVS